MDSWTRNSPFLWVRDKNLELKEHWRMLPNRELGSVWRTYSWCRIGSMESKDWKESWKPVIKMPILTSEPSSLLNHPPFHLWWTFLRVFSSLVWKCQMRTLRIWRPTWREPMPNSIRSSLIKPLSQMSSNLFYLHCASSTLWSVEERSSDHRDGARSTTSMMEIWLSVQMCSTTTWGTMMWCLTRIWDTSMVISCMEDISLMDGIEEPIELIYWPISSLNWCRIWVWLLVLDLLTLLSSTMMITRTSLKPNCQWSLLRCSDYIPMLKSTISLRCVTLSLKPSWMFNREDQAQEEDLVMPKY